MDVDRRNDILIQIAGGRAKEARITEVVSSIPSWADRPFKADQENFTANLKAYQDAGPIVKTLESRLAVAPGPIWKELTAEEQTALTNWTRAVDNLYGYVNTYFPSEGAKQFAEAALWVIAIGSFIAPLFLSEDENGIGFPFHIGPPALPPGMAPSRRVPAAVATQVQRPTFAPGAFSRIPQTSRVTSVQTEIMRPAVSTPPWRTAVPASAGALPGTVAPGFRAFARPLGPSMPVTAQTIQATATAAPPSAESPHGARIYPRFRRQ